MTTTMTPFGLLVIAMGISAFLPLTWCGIVELYRIVKQYLKVKKANNYGRWYF